MAAVWYIYHAVCPKRVSGSCIGKFGFSKDSTLRCCMRHQQNENEESDRSTFDRLVDLVGADRRCFMALKQLDSRVSCRIVVEVNKCSGMEVRVRRGEGRGGGFLTTWSFRCIHIYPTILGPFLRCIFAIIFSPLESFVINKALFVEPLLFLFKAGSRVKIGHGCGCTVDDATHGWKQLSENSAYRCRCSENGIVVGG
jgi:hypothetical protein